MDEILRCLQSAFAQGPIVRFHALSVWMDLVGLLKSKGAPVH